MKFMMHYFSLLALVISFTPLFAPTEVRVDVGAVDAELAKFKEVKDFDLVAKDRAAMQAERKKLAEYNKELADLRAKEDAGDMLTEEEKNAKSKLEEVVAEKKFIDAHATWIEAGTTFISSQERQAAEQKLVHAAQQLKDNNLATQATEQVAAKISKELAARRTEVTASDTKPVDTSTISGLQTAVRAGSRRAADYFKTSDAVDATKKNDLEKDIAIAQDFFNTALGDVFIIDRAALGSGSIADAAKAASKSLKETVANLGLRLVRRTREAVKLATDGLSKVAKDLRTKIEMFRDSDVTAFKAIDIGQIPQRIAALGLEARRYADIFNNLPRTTEVEADLIRMSGDAKPLADDVKDQALITQAENIKEELQTAERAVTAITVKYKDVLDFTVEAEIKKNTIELALEDIDRIIAVIKATDEKVKAQIVTV